MRAPGTAWLTMSTAASRASSLSTIPLSSSYPSADSTVTCRPACANCSAIRLAKGALGESSDMVVSDLLTS